MGLKDRGHDVRRPRAIGCRHDVYSPALSSFLSCRVTVVTFDVDVIGRFGSILVDGSLGFERIQTRLVRSETTVRE